MKALAALLAGAVLCACAGPKGKSMAHAAPAAPSSATEAGAGSPRQPPSSSAAENGAAGGEAAPLLASPEEEFRKSKPKPLPAQASFQAPVPVEKRLTSGARLLVVENHALPLVAVQVLIGTGNDGDPLPRAGLADFVAAMLTEGTRMRTAKEVATAIEDLAATLNASAGPETTRIALSCLKENLPPALDVMADVLLHPAFRPEDVARVRGLLLTELLQKKANPAAIARDEMDRLLYGERHPLGQPSGGTPDSLQAIQRSDLERFHDTWFRPNHAIVAVVGDVTAAEAKKLLDERLASWRPRPLPKLRFPAVPELRARAITLIEKPSGSQSQIWVLGRLFPARDPDAVPMRVANNILGGLFGSRLNMNLREAKGYSYGVRSAVSLLRSSGFIYASGGIVTKNTAEALIEYEKELRTFSTGEVSEEELAKAKEAYVRSLPSALETGEAVAASIAGIAFNGLPLDYYRALPARIARVTRQDVARVAKKYVKPDAWPIVIVGPRGPNEEKLRSMDFGPVHVRAAAAAAGGLDGRSPGKN